MICHERVIYYDTLAEPIEIAVYGCVHLESENCDLKAFKTALKEDAKKKRYLLFMGDFFDLILPNDAKRFRPTAMKWLLVDPVTGQNRARQDVKDAIVDMIVDDAYRILKPHAEAGRIIGFLDGNHERSYVKRGYTNPTARLIESLNQHTPKDGKITHLGLQAFIRLILRQRGKKDIKNATGRACTLFTHHGFGAGSRTRGSSITKYWRHMADYDCHVGVYAHDHRSQSDASIQFSMIGHPPRTKAKKRLLIICGTFLKTIAGGVDPSYGEERGYSPSHIGRHILWLQAVANNEAIGYPLRYDVAFEGRA